MFCYFEKHLTPFDDKVRNTPGICQDSWPSAPTAMSAEGTCVQHDSICFVLRCSSDSHHLPVSQLRIQDFRAHTHSNETHSEFPPPANQDVFIAAEVRATDGKRRSCVFFPPHHFSFEVALKSDTVCLHSTQIYQNNNEESYI